MRLTITDISFTIDGPDIDELLDRLASIEEKLQTMTDNLDTELSRLQTDVAAETTATTNLTTAFNALRAQIPAPGTTVTPAQVQAFHAALDTLEAQTTAQGTLIGTTPPTGGNTTGGAAPATT